MLQLTKFFSPSSELLKELPAPEADESRTLWALISTDSKDRDGDIVRTDGLDFSRYMKNPVVMWAHRFDQPPIGKCLEIRKTDHAVMAKVKFADTPFADDIYKLYKGGFLNTWSVSFIPKEKTFLLNPDTQRSEPSNMLSDGCGGPATAIPEDARRRRLRGEKEEPAVPPVMRHDPYRFDVRKSEVLEFSAVPVPAQSDTGTLTIAPDAKTGAPVQVEELVGACATETVKGWVKAFSGEYDETVNIAKDIMALDVDTGDAESKGALPFRRYPLVEENGAWDGPAETTAASADDLRAMCAWVDSEADPESKAAYKLPHHRQSDKHTVWSGVAAAMTALLGGRGGVDIPAGDRRGVYNHLRRHYAEFDKEAPEFKSTDADDVDTKGGAGSGNHGHAGRPGEVGGSGPSGSSTLGDIRRVHNLRGLRTPELRTVGERASSEGSHADASHYHIELSRVYDEYLRSNIRYLERVPSGIAAVRHVARLHREAAEVHEMARDSYASGASRGSSRHREMARDASELANSASRSLSRRGGKSVAEFECTGEDTDALDGAAVPVKVYAVHISDMGVIRKGALAKTIAERGVSGKVPLVVKLGKEASVVLEVESIQETLDKAGTLVITEGRIRSVTLCIPDGEAAPAENATTKTSPAGQQGREPSNAGTASLDDGAKVVARAMAAIASAIGH